MDHLVENLGAARLSLTPDDVWDMDAAFSALPVHGGRMSAKHMKVAE